MTFTIDKHTYSGTFGTDSGPLEFAKYGDRGTRWTLYGKLIGRNEVMAIIGTNATGLEIIEQCISMCIEKSQEEIELARGCLREASRRLYLPAVNKNAPKELAHVCVEEMHIGSGVYFLTENQNIVYVGQSKNIPLRIASHIADKQKKFDSVFYLKLPKNDLLDVESEWISSLRPKYNKTINHTLL